jgi:pyruvate dehydrogenase E2 component (dihydrolipoamide acetyltransferase)
MPTPILMPKLSDDMREGKILAWKKKEGDAVEAGEVIAEVETDKSNLEVEAYNAGTLVKIVAPVGATVPCGQPIALVAEEGDEAAAAPVKDAATAKGTAAPPDSQPAAAAVAPTSKSAAEHPPAQPEAAPAAPGVSEEGARSAAAEGGQEGAGRLRASPLAKKMAREADLDLRTLPGSGPRGRVVKADVERALSGARPEAPEPQTRAWPAPAAAKASAPAPKAAAPRPPMPLLREETLPMSGMRKTIARRMIEAKPGSPHFYLTIEVEMSRALELRAQLNEQVAAEWGGKVSVNDLVLRAAALAAARRPEVNASFAGESVRRHGSVHLGFAVSVEDGLITPVIRDAQQKSLSQIAREARELAERARARRLKPDEYQGGTFTVSNLGMYGVRSFSAIINPGEAAILAVGAVEKRPVVLDGEVRAGNLMTATFSGDHRVVDGALGAQLLQEFRAVLEQPLRLLG